MFLSFIRQIILGTVLLWGVYGCKVMAAPTEKSCIKKCTGNIENTFMGSQLYKIEMHTEFPAYKKQDFLGGMKWYNRICSVKNKKNSDNIHWCESKCLGSSELAHKLLKKGHSDTIKDYIRTHKERCDHVGNFLKSISGKYNVSVVYDVDSYTLIPEKEQN